MQQPSIAWQGCPLRSTEAEASLFRTIAKVVPSARGYRFLSSAGCRRSDIITVLVAAVRSDANGT